MGEAFNRVKNINEELLTDIVHWTEIIGFRNILAHGYDVVDDRIVWDTINNFIPKLLKQLSDKLN